MKVYNADKSKWFELHNDFDGVYVTHHGKEISTIKLKYEDIAAISDLKYFEGVI